MLLIAATAGSTLWLWSKGQVSVGAAAAASAMAMRLNGIKTTDEILDRERISEVAHRAETRVAARVRFARLQGRPGLLESARETRLQLFPVGRSWPAALAWLAEALCGRRGCGGYLAIRTPADQRRAQESSCKNRVAHRAPLMADALLSHGRIASGNADGQPCNATVKNAIAIRRAAI